MKRKVRIKSLPKGYHMMPDGNIMKDADHMAHGGSVKKNLGPVPRDRANLEAERGEIAITDLDRSGNLGVYNIGGQRHSNGGTPLNLDPGSFIFSDTKKMKIKDPDFLAQFGKKKAVTPAKLVKPFMDMNDYTAALYSDTADDIQKRTANSMIDNYKKKISQVAAYQEGMKGQEAPTFAQPYMDALNTIPELAAYGGYIPKAQNGLNGLRGVYGIQENNPLSVNRGQTQFAPFVVNTDVSQQAQEEKPKTSRNDQFSAVDPVFVGILEELGAIPQIGEGDFTNPDYVNYSRIQGRVPGTEGLYEDAQANLEGWVKRMEDLGYDFSDWKDADGNIDIKSIKGEDPRVKAYQEWWNPKVDQWIEEANQARQDAGYEPFMDDQIKSLQKQKFYNTGDPNAQPGSYVDSKLGTYTTSRFLPKVNYEMQADTVYFCVDGQVMGQSVRPGTQPQAPSGTDVKGPFTSQAAAAQACGVESTSVDVEEVKGDRTYPFQQDVNNYLTNLRNKRSEKLRLSYSPQLAPRLMDAVYLDPTEAISEIMGSSRSMADAIGAFAGPNRQLSGISKLSGEAGQQAARIEAEYANTNAKIANEAERANAQLLTENDRLNLLQRITGYDKNVKAQEVFDEKMRGYRTNGNELWNALNTNLAKAKFLNKLYPDFQINMLPGMYGEIMANPEVLRAMQDPAKYKGMQQDQRRELMNRVTEEAWTLFPEKTAQDGKDQNAAGRAAYITKLMSGKDSEPGAYNDPYRDYLRSIMDYLPQVYE